MIYCGCLGKTTETVKQGNCVFNPKKSILSSKAAFQRYWAFPYWAYLPGFEWSQEVALYSISTLLYLSLCAIFLLAK